MVPVIVYFMTNQAVKKYGDLLPDQLKQISSFLPFVAVLVCHTIMARFNKKKAEAESAGVIGKEAPSFTLKFKKGEGSTPEETTLKEFMEKSGKPVVIDFYQNA